MHCSGEISSADNMKHKIIARTQTYFSRKARGRQGNCVHRKSFQTYIILQCWKVTELDVSRLVLQELLEVDRKLVHLEDKNIVLLPSDTKGNKNR